MRCIMIKQIKKSHLLTIFCALVLSACQSPDMFNNFLASKKVSNAKQVDAKLKQVPVVKSYALSKQAPIEAYNSKELAKKKTVLFGIDSYKVNADDRKWLKSVASYATKKDISIRVEGYTCELGSSEYNVALGFKRAQAVADTLSQMGVADDKIVLVSYGKEKPVDDRHAEEAWRKNRRVEVSY